MRPLYGPSYYVMAKAYSRMGMHEEAIAAAEESVRSPSKYAGPHLLGIAYALAGKRQEALEIAESADASKAWFTAQIYAALPGPGQKDGPSSLWSAA